jgi:MFS family permease
MSRTARRNGQREAPVGGPGPGGQVAPESVAGRAFASLRAPHFAKVYATGWIWSIARWGMGFLGAYVVNDLTGSPRLVQLTGSLMWAPLLLAGVAGGAVSDRFDRRRIVLVQLALMAPVTAAVGVAAVTGGLAVWMIYPFMFLVGIGWIVDMTVRRALIYDLVGEDRVNGAMALEMVSSSAGLAIGALLGGAMIELLGVGQAYLAIAVGLVVALAVMWRVPSPPRTQRPASASFRSTIVEGFRALPANKALVSILGVTVFVDFFHFSYTPILQVIGRRLDASPLMIGMLASVVGLGMMLGSLWVAAFQPHRGRAYFVGSALAFVALFGVASFERYWVVLAFLLAAGVCMGLFGACQTALAITSTGPEMRGRAMGLLSMAIGALPVGMYALGELAQAVGAPTAIVVFNAVGLVGLLVWGKVRPEVLRTP